jgi:hypothetical protein
MKKAALIAAGMVCMSGLVFAGRPLTVDDADPVDKGMFEMEAGCAYEKDSECKHWDYPFGITYGLVSGLEVGVGFGVQSEKRVKLLDDGITEERVNEDGFSDVTLGAKWQFIESCPLGARHAIVPSIKIPTADDKKQLGSGKADYDLTWISSCLVCDKCGIHLNVGYSGVGGPDKDVVHCGLAMDYQFHEAVQCVVEVFAEKAIGDGSDTAGQFNLGFRWRAVDDLTVDVSAGSGFDDEGPDLRATVGLTWTFGFNADDK